MGANIESKIPSCIFIKQPPGGEKVKLNWGVLLWSDRVQQPKFRLFFVTAQCMAGCRNQLPPELPRNGQWNGQLCIGFSNPNSEDFRAK